MRDVQSFDDANDMTKAIEARLTASALQLADRGFFVLRCAPGDKRPMDFWKNTLSNDQRKVASQWGSTPDANVGVACMESGIFVIDVDGELGEQGRFFHARQGGLLVQQLDDVFTDGMQNVNPMVLPNPADPAHLVIE